MKLCLIKKAGRLKNNRLILVFLNMSFTGGRICDNVC